MVLGRSSRMKRNLKKGAVALSLSVALLTGVAWADLPEPPAHSDIALRLLPVSDDKNPLDQEALKRHPVYRLIGKVGVDYFGVEPFRFFDATFEGTAIAAILSKPGSGGGSSLKAYFDDQARRERWSADVRELTSLANDLEDHFQTTEQYPADLQTYLDEVRYYEPYLSSGVSYRYEVLKDGKDYRLTMVFEPGIEQVKLGPAPVFSSQSGRKNLQPTLPPVPLNFVVGAKIKDKSSLQSFLTETLGTPQGGFWRSPDMAAMPLVITLRGEWLVASDQMSNLGDFLKSLKGEKPGWSANPAFKKVARNLKTDGPFLLFVDTPRLLKAMDAPTTGPEGRLASLLGPLGYSVIPYAESQFALEVFMGVEAPKGSDLAEYFASSGSLNPASGMATSNVPWDISNVFAVDYANGKGLLDALVGLFPDAEDQYGMGQDIFLGMFGLDAQEGFNNLAEGPVIVSFERIDLVTTTIESFMGMPGAPEETAPPESLDDSDPMEGQDPAETTEEDENAEPGVSEEGLEMEDAMDAEPVAEPEKSSPVASLAAVPATFAFQVPLETNREALLSLMNPYMKEMSTETVYGVEVKTSSDGKLSYALDENWLYVSGGRTDRLIHHMLEAAHGRKQTLATIDSWSRFSVGRKGRLLAFGHQKVDAVNSLVKGFLLFMGSEFRPLAEEFGELRDYHSVLTAIPDGFLAVGEMVKGDER